VVASYSGSFFTDVPLLKSPYGNDKILVYFDIINLVGNYMVVNELKNSFEK